MDATVTRIMIYCIMIYEYFLNGSYAEAQQSTFFLACCPWKVRACSSTTNHIRPKKIKKCPGKVVPGHLAGFNMSATLPSAAVVQKGKPCERRILWYLPWPLKSGWVVLGSSNQFETTSPPEKFRGSMEIWGQALNLWMFLVVPCKALYLSGASMCCQTCQ
jgi:hypothetical protein